MGNEDKAIDLAFKEAKGGIAFEFIAAELIKQKKEKKIKKFLEDIQTVKEEYLSEDEILLRKIFGYREPSILLEGTLYTMIQAFTSIGKFSKAEALITKIRDKGKQLKLLVIMARFERELNKDSKKYLKKANDFWLKHLNVLTVKVFPEFDLGVVSSQVSLAQENAVVGNKDRALKIANGLLHLLDKSNKSHDYYYFTRRLANFYKMIGKKALAERVINATDIKRYKEDEVLEQFNECLKNADLDKAYLTLKRISKSWAKVGSLVRAIDFCAKNRLFIESSTK